jgi:hypothetical protein
MQLHAALVMAFRLLFVGDGGDAAVKKDLQKFQGNWILVSAERDGKQMPQEEVKKIKLAIQANKFVLQRDSLVISDGTLPRASDVPDPQVAQSSRRPCPDRLHDLE